MLEAIAVILQFIHYHQLEVSLAGAYTSIWAATRG